MHKYDARPAVEGQPQNSRGLAQPGSAPALGAGCRGFKSLIPDHFFPSQQSLPDPFRWTASSDLDQRHAPVAQLDRATAF
jgi:hypothetical protein